MPPSRRQPRPAQPPARRPRVAGLRRPAGPATGDATDPSTGAAGQPAEPDRAFTGELNLDRPDTEDAAPIQTAPTETPPTETAPGETPPADTTLPDTTPAETEPAETEPVGQEREDTASTDPDADQDEPAEAQRRRPAGKRRSSGAVQPADLADAESEARSAGYPAPGATAVAGRNRAINTAIVLGVAALIFAGLALWFRGEANSLSDGADSNSALTDTARTSEVIGQVRVALEKALSYDYTKLDATSAAVKDNLTGKALCEYDALFGQVRELAPTQKIVLTSKVRELGVTRLDGDRAELLVFVDQTTTRADQNKTTAAGAQFVVRAERQDSAWKINQFDMLGQPLPDGTSMAQC